jgi:uncharacterized protein with FMN-binding domain
MKRAFAAMVATVAGLVLLLGFKTHSAKQSVQPPVATSSNPPAPLTSTPQTSTPQTSAPSSANPAASPASATSAKPAPTAKGQTRTVTGTSVRTRYGDVEVQVVFTGSQITDVVPVRLPDSNDIDQEIDQQAVPILIQETLSAQSANIQAVSGATYTSDGYIQSLQSALDKAK